VPVSRKVAKRVTDDHELELSFPKRRRIAFHTPHHKKAPVSWCRKTGRVPKLEIEDIFASDEQSWSFELKPNSRNQCFVVEKGTRSSTNISQM
jgi:hypothetical protein